MVKAPDFALKEEYYQRYLRVMQNDLENIAYGLIAIWATALMIPQGSTDHTLIKMLNKVFACTFVLARLLHTVVYLKGLQPWRTIMFSFGLMSTWGQIVMGMMLFFDKKMSTPTSFKYAMLGTALLLFKILMTTVKQIGITLKSPKKMPEDQKESEDYKAFSTPE